MSDGKTFNILMYSHDTYGLGHIRRTMAIAGHLSRPDTNILILTGSPMAGRFKFPQYVDYVRIPGMIKKTNEDYFPLAIRIDPRQALEIRKSLILATASTFKPDLFIVDKEPLGLKKEVLPTLEWIRENLPLSRTVIGLRDVMDDSETIKKDWYDKGVYEAIESLYSEVWIYGNQNLYDPIKEYDIPRSIAEKCHFTGYIPRRVPERKRVVAMRRRLHASCRDPLVTVTTGGGGDGYPVLDAYLSMLESMIQRSVTPPFKSVIITGPFLSAEDWECLERRARALGVRVFQFFTDMETLFAASDLVVCMGGYNTVCEILSQKRPALVIPRETPRMEQSIRAGALKQRHLLDSIPWGRIGPEILENKILTMLGASQTFVQAMETFELTGIREICSRISLFRKLKNDHATDPVHDPQGVPAHL
ncbi:MAG: glycosyltransferase [Pseudomonadota bacterium]